LRDAPGTIRRRLDLEQRQPCVIEKHSSGGGQRHAARLTLQQLYAYFGFQVANLSTQRRLGRVQPPLGSSQHAAFLRDGNEIAQMPKFHSPSYIFKA
jgi:hypothetical protein